MQHAYRLLFLTVRLVDREDKYAANSQSSCSGSADLLAHHRHLERLQNPRTIRAASPAALSSPAATNYETIEGKACERWQHRTTPRKTA